MVSFNWRSPKDSLNSLYDFVQRMSLTGKFLYFSEILENKRICEEIIYF